MRTVITHEEDGIFVGAAMGLAFFSMLDAAGQDQVATFLDEADARDFICQWEPEMDPDRFSYVEVKVDTDHATIADLVEAGLQDKIGTLLENAPAAARC